MWRMSREGFGMLAILRVCLVVGAIAALGACTTSHDHDGCCIRAPTSY